MEMFGARQTGMAPLFVITGTGRCGTRFTANVLRALDVDAGHEDWFNPHGTSKPVAGDVSWLAVPRLPGREVVALQLRHPMAVINSLVGIRMFSSDNHADYQRFIFIHQPGLTGDDVHDAMFWYLNWNQRAERHARFVYRIEDLDPALLHQLTVFIGHERDVESCKAALEAMPQDLDAHVRNHRDRAELAWTDLPEGQLKDQLAMYAERHGYLL